MWSSSMVQIDSLTFWICRIEPYFVTISFDAFKFLWLNSFVISDSEMITYRSGFKVFLFLYFSHSSTSHWQAEWRSKLETLRALLHYSILKYPLKLWKSSAARTPRTYSSPSSSSRKTARDCSTSNSKRTNSTTLVILWEISSDGCIWGWSGLGFFLEALPFLLFLSSSSLSYS